MKTVLLMGAIALKYTSSEEDIICEFYEQQRQLVKQSEEIHLFE